ncbi:MAG: hypothetical protein ACTSV0_03000, partial [Candidatus Freyarchaeota archaeon]
RETPGSRRAESIYFSTHLKRLRVSLIWCHLLGNFGGNNIGGDTYKSFAHNPVISTKHTLNGNSKPLGGWLRVL